MLLGRLDLDSFLLSFERPFKLLHDVLLVKGMNLLLLSLGHEVDGDLTLLFIAFFAPQGDRANAV